MLPTELLLDPALRQGSVALLAAAYAGVCGAVIAREQKRRKIKSTLTLAAADSPSCLIAYASQTGEAEAIAVETGRHLHQAGLVAQVVELE